MNIKYLTKIGIIILFISNISGSCVERGNNKAMNNQKTNKYNTVTSFELNKKLNFPDFTIQHIKHQKVQGPNNSKWERQTFYFNISTDQGSQEISWSTGVIRNTKFMIKDTEYELVLGSYQDPDSKTKAFKNLELNELMILKPKKVKFEKQHIKKGDIVFRSTKKNNGEVLFNEYGIIEKTILGLFVWDNRNTLKQPFKTWSTNCIDNKIAVFRKKSKNFQINKMELKDESFNYLFDSEELELVTKNF